MWTELLSLLANCTSKDGSDSSVKMQQFSFGLFANRKCPTSTLTCLLLQQRIKHALCAISDAHEIVNKASIAHPINTSELVLSKLFSTYGSSQNSS